MKSGVLYKMDFPTEFDDLPVRREVQTGNGADSIETYELVFIYG